MKQDMNNSLSKALRAVFAGTLMFVTCTNAMAQGDTQPTPTGVVVHGNVYGGGNQADVKINSEVNMSTGTVEGNVYGGGNLGDVGTHADQDPASVGNYDWTANTGLSKVTITGGTIGLESTGVSSKEHGNVFGGGKGEATTFECEKGMVYKTNVSIQKSGTTNTLVYRNVYGGGEVSRVENDTEVTIGTASGEDEPTIKGSVFAAGAGVETHGYSALVRGHSTITVQGKATVEHNVYGGGELASVGRYKVKTPANANDSDVPKSLPYGMPAHLIDGGKSTVVIQDNATIGSTANTGHVYGAGKGLEPREYDYASGVEGENGYHIDEHKPERMVSGNTWEHFASPADYLQFVETLALSAETDVTINGSNVTVKGSVFGGSESGFVYHNTDVEIQAGTIEGDAFGGGRGLESFAEAGRVRGNTKLTVSGGAVEGNVYGGGNLGDVGTIDKSDPDYNYEWKNSEANGNIFTPFLDNTAHNNKITSNNTNTGICEVIISDGTIGVEGKSTENHASGHVFGAGKGSETTWWCEKAIAYATNVTVSGGEIHGNVYGGGQVGRVEDDAKVVIGAADATGAATPTISGSIFGAGAGLHTHGYSALVRGNSDVTVQGTAQIGGSVYGGGQIASVGKFHVVGGLPSKPKSGGTCIVNIKDNAHIGTSGTGHIYGACKGVNSADISSDERKSMQLSANRPTEKDANGHDLIDPNTGEKVFKAEHEYWDYYDSEQKFVWVYYKTEPEYQTFLKTLALTSNTHVTIDEESSVYGSVFGGGEMGITLGKVEVDMTGGTVAGDVCGGGSLADTNTANWENNALVSSFPYHEETMITRPGYKKKNVPVGESVVGLYTKSGDNYTPTAANAVAVQGTDYYKPVQGASVKGLYTRTGSEGNYTYTEITDENATAAEDTNVKYFALYTTTVDLLGGTIKGDAYGGGLGQLGTPVAGVHYTQEQANEYNTANGLNEGDDGYKTTDDWKVEPVAAADGAGSVKAMVYGDVSVNLGSSSGSSATSFYTTYDNAGTEQDQVKVVKSGRVFGCNNLNGSPKGDVTVTVWRTVAGNGGEKVRTAAADKASNKVIMDNYPDNYESVEGYKSPTYEVAAVYGGGNLASYEAIGKKTHVIIYGCDLTSIQTVYGGGNAAAVPETDVDVHSCYEIGALFGGGNGKDKYKINNTWQTNPGANVNGNANTLIYGGTVHEAYGGSNEKGTITGSVTIDIADSGLASTDPKYCAHDVAKLVGAGKNADVNGDLKIIMGCKPETKFPLVYGGADNANVNGDVELTITSGNFGKVIGGNNNGGVIKGHIILNIEETTCIPINIDHLYLCGYNAAYSEYGYYVKTEETEVVNGNGIGAITETAVLKDGKLQLIPRESMNDSHLPVDTYSFDEAQNKWTWTTSPITGTGAFTPYDPPVLNVISCTSIGEVFGGGYGTDATVYGNPTVNINMIPGAHASKIKRSGSSNAHDLGAIGSVYGGGDAAAVYGNTNVNIGTATEVPVYVFADNESGEYELQYENGAPKTHTENVEGAYITGNVYGGGKLADVTGNAFVNVCAEQVAVVENNEPTGEFTYNVVNYTETDYQGVIIGGNVYGGGEGYAKMEEGTAGEAFLCAKAMIGVDGEGIEDSDNNGVADHPDGGTSVVIGNGTVTGNVYGGGMVGRVEKNTKVTIGIGEGTGNSSATSTPVVIGNVFGAGAGTNTHGYSALVRGTSTVLVEGDAKVRGSVYGGGEKASVGRYRVDDDGLPVALNNALAPTSGYCYVTIRGYAEIGPDDMEMTKAGGPSDAGHVFGACQGVLPYDDYAADAKPFHMNGKKVTDGWEDEAKTYPAYNANADLDADYAKFIKSLALATQTLVTIEGNPFIKGSVYGGSENGYVQKDTRVVISGGQIGNGYVQMDDNGNYLDNPLSVNRRYTATEWSNGYLDTTNDRQALKDLVSPDANTHYYTSSLPECASWQYGTPYAPYDKFADSNGNYPSGSAVAAAEGGRPTGSDGHTFYGNVFGGGSGYYPYKPGRWFEDAGAVYGNTQVDITGGHILTNIYGGNEMTNVGVVGKENSGKCTINFGGTATLGVPRTLKQIDAHPVTCYLFGAGKGDQRVFFNKSTNVIDVVVNVTGGTIYGSVFGGGEDGHVLRDVTMTIGKVTTTGEGDEAATTISGPTIGNWGTSYVDGNVFGGGRGFGGDAYTAGNIAGSVEMEIKGGNILGSIYGGGRLGSVGYGLFDAETNGQPTPGYGEMRADTDTETGFSTSNFFTNGRGHIDITISGGTIGNTHEYIIPNATNMAEAGIPEADRDISKWNDENKYWNTWRTYHNIPKTEFDTTTGHLMHTKGGNVFAGGMGRFYQLDGSTAISAVDWWKLGNVKSTTVTITGGTIKSNVYGGGELGQVVGYHTAKNAANQDVNVGTEVNINSGTIGTKVVDGSNVVQYTFGSVFGGGYGSLEEKIEVQRGTTITSYPKYIAGRVKAGTKVNMTAGSVLASVYGGGEMAAVGESKTLGETLTTGHSGDTYVSVSGGTVGIAPITISGSNRRYFGGAKMGNVYGGGSGHGNTVRSGHVYGNTNVTISAGSVSGEPNIYHNVYGGGAYGSVGDFTYQTGTDAQTGTQKVIGISGLNENHSNSGVATVTITGGTIGYDGKENGMVFGSSRGDINEPGARDDYTAWVYDTHVTIGTSGSQTGPQINGTVYGSGENGHTYNNTVVTVNSGTIGIADSSNPGYTVTSNGKSYSGAEYPYRGNVYGGGCGTDKYYENHALETHDGNGQLFNSLAGIVYGTTTVNIYGGTVVRNVYGAGAMGSVGKTVTTTNESSTTTTVTGGTTTINISGGTIGVDGTNGDGNVFGAARGDADAKINEFALVKKETGVSVTGGTIKGNVYGGGELGCVGTFTVSPDMRTFTWQDTNGAKNTPGNEKNSGVCNVTVDGSSAVINGHVYGAGKGKEDTFWCEKGIAYSTNVNIKNGTVNQNVYGGGEVGRVETDTQVKIGNGTGTAEGTFAPTIMGSIFGGGAGVETHGYSALVRRNTTVTVEGNADVRKSIYGGGMIASVGRYGLDEHDMPSILQGGGYCYVTVQGSAQIGEDVFGAGKGVTPAYTYVVSDDYDVRMNNSKRMVPYSPYNETTKKGQKESDWKKTWDYVEDYPEDYSGIKFVWEYFDELLNYSTYLETLALATHPEVTIDGNATVRGSVFGGGELGLTKGSVIVTIKGGTIEEDVYGGGSLANTNTTSTVDLDGDGTTENIDPTTKVILKGGTINRNVYGGGLGRLAKEAQGTEGEEGYQSAVSEVKAKVYGEVLVELNKPTTTTTGEGEGATTTTTYGDCEVKGTIFGCNNLNGSPQKNVTVHVYKTVTKSEGVEQAKPTKNTNIYEVTAVYGGGNLAAYYPDDATARETAIANVIIDGCDLTSIKSVYGGGNAASVPATEVVVNGTYEIDEVFGGGNGKDKVSYDGGVTYVDNPGANVGLLAYPNAANAPYDTKENRKTNYGYGIGEAHATIYGGTVHTVYGGSNTKGNVREKSRTTLEDHEQCTYNVGDAFGGGNNAPQDGDAVLEVGCIRGLDIAYGGASNADVNGDVILNITNGTYGRVFGGNNLGGAIRGSILVNIEETGCNPIVIGELYCGGNEAAYSVYGYNDDGTVKETGSNPVPDPVLNVKSFTSIGKIFGGGYGARAKMVASPTVNINVIKGRYSNEKVIAEGEKVYNFDIPSHESGAIGAIGSVFGGGNAAEVIGTPHVNIGTKVGEVIPLVSKPIEDSEGRTPSAVDWTPSYQLVTVEGVDIRDNVYGAGNNAQVTGNTEVVIGKNNDVKTYSFTSYSASNGGDVWSSGLAQTTGKYVTLGDSKLAEVEILTNGKYDEYVGKKFYVDPEGSGRLQLYNADKEATSLWVSIEPFAYKTYSFKSYGASSGGTEYSTGTAAPTGNFKEFDGTEYMQIVVLTNPGEASWVGKTFYVPANAETNGNARTQLHKANGDPVNVWVSIEL